MFLCIALQEQKFLMGVIVMVPFYAVESVSCFNVGSGLRFSVVEFEYIEVGYLCG